MILARVVGKAVSTLKHRSLRGARLLICEPIGAASNDPVLAMDKLGAHAGDVVVLSSDGIGAREMVQDETSPARWWTMCLCDDEGQVLNDIR